ncbi:MAG TPA: ribbon-helix-helix protein, CopG family [Candidatus Paceibacterota bacterium]
MTTLSVPLPPHLEELVKRLAKQRGSNKAAIVREALERFAEEEAVAVVLRAEKELSEGKILRGDLRKLMKKIS